MSDQFEFKMTNLCVVKLRNRTTITCVPRLDIDHFNSQLDSPRLVQSFLKLIFFGFLFPMTAFSDSLSENWGAFIAGGFSTIVIHEVGHMAVAEYHDIDYEYDGVTIIYPDADFTESEHLRVASAGFQAQWIATEFAFRKLARVETLTPNSRSFSRGIVAGHAAITFAYMTFLKDHEDGDIEGMSQASGLSNNELALLVAIPAALDSWRLTARDVPDWVPKLSVAFKGIGLAAIWTF